MTSIHRQGHQSSPPPSQPRARRLGGVWHVSGSALLSRGLRYMLLATYVGTVYVVVVSVGGVRYAALAPSWWLVLLALLLIAATVMPIHSWLRVHIDRLVFDWHGDPYAVLNQLHANLDRDGADASRDVLPTIAASIAATLRLPYVAVETDLGAEPQTVAYGTPLPQTHQVRVPLAYRGTPIGALIATGRRAHESLSAADMHLLNDLARQVGIALYAARLSDDLQTSRQNLVTAREEERRRIRRDLHDSLGPTLASLRMQLGGVRRTLRDTPDEAEIIIDDLRDDLRAATADIRRLVYDLRPPLLDEHGVLGALQSLHRVAAPVALHLELPPTLPPLPAAVEVAVFRIASEAVHNVAQHSGATHCTLHLALGDGTLVLEVRDDGSGLAAEHAAGVGIASMRERAAELGGTLHITTDGGTLVSATIPWRPTP